GVKSFIDFARIGAIRGEISCPCNKYGHAKNLVNQVEGDIRDIEGDIEEEDIEEESKEDSEEDIGKRNPGDEDIRYKKFLEECDKELYPGCKLWKSFT
nr:hypothetical protein [Tanacetum cinerariifolium]